jgi:hypothetical protein
MIVACEWNAWSAYLIHWMLGDRARLTLSATEPPIQLLPRILEYEPELVVLQVNLSYPERLPVRRAELVQALAQQGIPVWNGGIRDITKRAVQQLNATLGLPSCAASRDGAPDERVIVKNNFNAHSRPEKLLTAEQRTLLGYPPYQPSAIVAEPEYPILRRDQVPDAYWRDPALFLERYIANRDGDFVRVYFAGERCAICAARSEEGVKRLICSRDKVDYLCSRQALDAPDRAEKLPGPMRTAFRTAMSFARGAGLDFGALDLVLDDGGQAFVVDVNPTPYWGSEIHEELLDHLREGFFAK